MDTTNDLMTIPEMSTVLKTDARSLGEVIDALSEAESTYAAITRRAAYSSDEGPVVGLRDHLPALTGAEAAAARVASASERNVRQILGQVATINRVVVAPEVEAAAAAKLPLLSRVIETASLPELRDRLKAAIVAGDVADQYILASLVPARLANEPPVGQATGRPEAVSYTHLTLPTKRIV